MAATLYRVGEFEAARRHARRGVELWRSGAVPALAESVHPIAVVGCSCFGFEALSEWHLGEVVSSQAAMAEAIALAKTSKDTYALAEALTLAAILGYLRRDPAEVERLASNSIELSARNHFAALLDVGEGLRGWARSLSGDTAEGLGGIERAIAFMRARGWILCLPQYLATKAEALHLVNRTSEALAAIEEAEAAVESSQERSWSAELYRLRGVFLAALGADDTQIEASFCPAISTAKEQKSVSLAKRAEATYAEYRRQKASVSGGRGFRLPLW